MTDSLIPDNIEDKLVAADLRSSNSIVFVEAPSPTEVIRLDAKGFHYKGQLIEDAGEAHRLMLAFLHKHQPNPEIPTDEELVELYRKSYYECENRQGDVAQVFALRAVLARWGK